MNVLTSGIILYAFYQSICMDNDDDGPENKGSRGRRPLPKSLTSTLMPTEQESGGASGQSGGASSQPSRPANQAPDGTILVKMDVKNGFDNPRTNLHQFGGPNNLPHRELAPHPGYGYSCVYYNGKTLWTMDDYNYATRVTVFPTGTPQKSITIRLVNGGSELYRKGGKNQPWVKQ